MRSIKLSNRLSDLDPTDLIIPGEDVWPLALVRRKRYPHLMIGRTDNPVRSDSDNMWSDAVDAIADIEKCLQDEGVIEEACDVYLLVYTGHTEEEVNAAEKKILAGELMKQIGDDDEALAIDSINFTTAKWRASQQ